MILKQAILGAFPSKVDLRNLYSVFFLQEYIPLVLLPDRGVPAFPEGTDIELQVNPLQVNDHHKFSQKFFSVNKEYILPSSYA